MKIQHVKPRLTFVKSEPIPGLPFEEFWRTFDKLLDKGMIVQANIFLYRRYNPRWNEGLD